MSSLLVINGCLRPKAKALRAEYDHQTFCDDIRKFQNITSLQISELRKENLKLEKALNQLIGYDFNQDQSLELKMGTALQMYLTEELGIPEDFVVKVPFQKFLNTSNGEVAVEWDAVFVIDYTNRPADVIAPPKWPAHNTVFLLECKQHLVINQVLDRLDRRISNTIHAINSTITTKKRKLQLELRAQQSYFDSNPVFKIAIGGQNVDSSLEKAITCAGYLAVDPSGDDFKIKHHTV